MIWLLLMVQVNVGILYIELYDITVTTLSGVRVTTIIGKVGASSKVEPNNIQEGLQRNN